MPFPSSFRNYKSEFDVLLDAIVKLRSLILRRAKLLNMFLVDVS